MKRLLPSLLLSATCTTAALAQHPLRGFDPPADVGRRRGGGAVTYDSATQQYTISGSGENMWGTRDAFHFVWTRLTGNFILSTRARFLGKGVEAHRKIGWPIRPTLHSTGTHVTAALHGAGLMSLQYRRTAGGRAEARK